MKQRCPPEKIGDCRQFTERFKWRYGSHVFLFTIQAIFDYVHTPLAFPPPPPPKKKFLHNLCFSFLLGIAAVLKGIKNNAYEKFGGQIRCIMGDVQLAYEKKIPGHSLSYFGKNKILYQHEKPAWMTSWKVSSPFLNLIVKARSQRNAMSVVCFIFKMIFVPQEKLYCQTPLRTPRGP